ncbi:hypothetical protein REPUB_Repub01dG0008000 [Reevesia pubescens]
MEREKRKSEENVAVLGGSHKRAREEDGGGEETTVTDEEVDEFFAILRRIHEAVNYFKKGNCDMRSLTEMGKVESLNLRRNVDVNGSKKKKKVAENVKENVGLDLNADPGSEPF